jgi:shikimate kinase
MLHPLPDNLCLIGMPGSGKTTTGRLLARRTGKSFVDTDDLIRSASRHSLQHIVDHKGHLALRAIEQDVICALHCSNSVIATGGSAVYSASAMSHLAGMATIIYLAAPLATIESRIHDLDIRGLVRRADQDLSDLYAERTPLYEQYASVRVDASGAPEQTVDQIITALQAGIF